MVFVPSENESFFEALSTFINSLAELGMFDQEIEIRLPVAWYQRVKPKAHCSSCKCSADSDFRVNAYGVGVTVKPDV